MPLFEDKLTAAGPILCLCCHQDKIYVGQKNKTLEIFTIDTMQLVRKLTVTGDVTFLMAIESSGIVIGQESGYLDILSPYTDGYLVQERHAFGDKINWVIRTSRT